MKLLLKYSVSFGRKQLILYVGYHYSIAPFRLIKHVTSKGKLTSPSSCYKMKAVTLAISPKWPVVCSFIVSLI